MTAVRSAATVLFFLCALFRREANALFGPKFPPTKGQVWPAPNYSFNYGQYYYTVDYSNLDFEVTENNCDLLEEAFRRYTRIIEVQYGPIRFSQSGFSGRYPTEQTEHTSMYRGSITKLLIELKAPCEERPHLDMDEKYEVTVSTHNEQPSAVVKSDSVWGILRGMETFSQMLYRPRDDSTELWINATYIRDFPRYKHRGLLIDTSRHYLSLHTIFSILDAMAYNKLNVLHWHIVDDQSFPYQSTLFPSLSEKGAYHPVAMIYTKKDIQRVVEHARLRGIRVLAEFDVPGHTRSWGEAYPDLLTPCYKNGKVVGLGPMDPTKDNTYEFLEQLLNEVVTLFPDASFHFGGDEVDESCWESNPELQDYMKEHNMSSTHDLHAMFMRKVLELKMDRPIIPIIWQEVFDNGVPMPNNSLVQIWKDTTPYEITQVVNAGYDVLFSSCWYLDHLMSGGDWQKYYECDPALLLNDPNLKEYIIGGEACMWAESVDNSNVLTRIFPRSCATAERLWSDETLRDVNKAAYRLEEHACRMSQRGIPTQPPNGPGYCL